MSNETVTYIIENWCDNASEEIEERIFSGETEEDLSYMIEELNNARRFLGAEELTFKELKESAFLNTAKEDAEK